MNAADKRRLARILAHPDLGPRFKRLPVTQQRNILEHLRGADTQRTIRALDAERRAKEAARSQSRRDRIKPGGAYGYTKARATQPAKYRIWMVDEHDNVRAVRDANRAPGDILGDREYTEENYGDEGLHVVAVTVR